MASNFPNPNEINEDTGALWESGDTWTDSESGVIYIYDPIFGVPSWRTDYQSVYNDKNRYVELVGDNMVGDLTFADDRLRLSTSGAAEFAGGQTIIDSSGNIGIGTDADTKLHVSSTMQNVAYFENNKSACLVTFSDSTTTNNTQVKIGSVGNGLRFDAGGNEKARIDDSGRLLIGANESTKNYKLVIRNNAGEDGFEGGIFLQRATLPPDGGGHGLGKIVFGAGPTGDENESAQIVSRSDGNWGLNDWPSTLEFYTTSDGSNVMVERMRISSNGVVIITKPGSADQANLVLSSGGYGDQGSQDPRIQFSSSGFESAGTTEIRSSGAYNARALAFYTGTDTNGTERMRLDSLGQLLIGVTSASALCKLGMGYGSSTAGTYIDAGRTNRSGNGLNKLFSFRHGYWSGIQEVASIGVLTTSSNAGNGHGYGDLVFYTGESGNGDAGSTSTERMRIGSTGNVRVFNITPSPVNGQVTSSRFTLGANGWDTNTGSLPYYLEIAPSANYGAPWGYSRANIEFIIQSSRSSERYKFMVADYAGNVNFPQAISKGSGSFKIKHPLPEKKETQYLVHSFIEGPQADLIYRGYVTLKDGKATVNIDNAARMSEGTFVLLCGNVSCFTSNESDWTAVKGSVSGNILTIEAQDPTSTAKVSWMVIGERIDDHMLETDWTDENGRVITEPLTEEEEIRIASLEAQ